MMLLFYILLSTFIVSLISFIGILVLSIRERILSKVLLLLVAFAAGSLLGVSFFHLLPEAMETSEGFEVFASVLSGYVFVYFLEKFLLWHHCHKVKHVHTLGYANLISDSIHNFIDGLTIAVSFLSSVGLGIVSTLAISWHEIPQEIGDFGVLLYSRINKRKAIYLNFASALACVLGGLLGFFISSHVGNIVSLLLPFAAGNFIYISSSDMIPEIKKSERLKESLTLFLVFLLGIFVMLFSKIFLPH